MLSLLFPLFGKYAADSLKSAVEKTKFQALCGALIGGALLFAVFFICLTVFFLLWEHMSPVKAAAILALIWLLIAFVSLLAMKISMDRRRRERQKLLGAENAKLFAGTALSLAPGVLALGGKSLKRLGLLAVVATGALAAYGALHKDK